MTFVLLHSVVRDPPLLVLSTIVCAVPLKLCRLPTLRFLP